MNTPVSSRPIRRVVALGGVAVVAAAALSACGATTDASSASPAGQSSQRVADPDPSTIGLVSATTGTSTAADRGMRLRLRHVLHATWVTGGAKPTTHDAIRGEVTAVSASSITVRARDGVSMTFAVTSSTKVRERHAGKGTDSSIGKVAVGDRALVTGVGSSGLTARHVVYLVPASSSDPSALPQSSVS